MRMSCRSLRVECEADRASQTSNGHVYLGAQATARAADRFILGPPFLAPAACRWVRTMVESTIRYSRTSPRISATKHL
jgi:hypothetical protein